jgi:hypothetical protein
MEMDVDVMPNAQLACHVSFDNFNGWIIALWLVFLKGS